MGITSQANVEDEWKLTIGRSMRKLGFKVNYQKGEKTDEGECYVYYTGFDTEVYTQMSYKMHSEITITWHERSDVKLPVRIRAVLENVEKEFVESGVAACTSFKFGKVFITELGTSYRASIPCYIMEEVNHG